MSVRYAGGISILSILRSIFMNNSHSHRRFSIIFLSIAFFIPLIVGLFNWAVDPYEIFNTPRIDNVNRFKSEVESQLRLYKALKIAKIKPKVILLGSSRVSLGLDPNFFANYVDYPVYNAGFNGANFLEIYEFFHHALRNQSDLKMVIIGLDFFAFNKNNTVTTSIDFSKLNKLWGVSEYFFPLLLSKNTIQSSLATIKKNYSLKILPDDSYSLFLSNGQSNLKLYKAEDNPILIMGEEVYISQMLNSRNNYCEYQLCEKRLGLFKKMVQTCKEQNIELYVYINPCKVMYWESLYQAKHWDNIEKWKRSLADIHPIWDFSGYNEITTDDRCYYECSHYKPEIGNKIIASFFGNPSFGYLLKPETIEQDLISIRQLREEWKQSKVLNLK